ncbi:phosphatidylinositol alpha-1,6-mannosyltransferase [Cyclonatronum proteinivorum]|uniref:Phosphatidylinositol alpha-1,6-mannosyltransferase n=1 Tax=Cyclonatronum proteinivorum TaxID=1457365 RepID=A0A345UN50_9BACT|nr:glycosyltransferase family 4 protein [Cyclonatronum proteinivorum]AXJ01902.1 phosphatidylinositol alpha-1,6-mannosyltransferase [Cyclonatronum proteinivorum]
MQIYAEEPAKELGAKTLLYITQDFPPGFGGINTYSAELCVRFAEYFGRLTVVAPYQPGCEAWDEMQPYNVVRIKCKSAFLGWVVKSRIPKLLEEVQPDILFHAQWTSLAAAKKARKSGFKGSVVCAAHARELLREPGLPFPLPQLFRAYRQEYMQLPDLWLPVSHFADQLLEALGIAAANRQIVHNGTDPFHFRDDDDAQTRAETRRSLGLKAEDFVLVTTARIVARKGIDTVIEALKRLFPEHPLLRYVVIGTGDQRENLAQKAKEAGLGAIVQFIENVSHEQLPHIYQAADLFVMVPKTIPPDVEGFGLVYLEANACGLPVIGSTSGGVPDAIAHDETGLLVSEQNPAELASAIEYLIKDPGKRKLYGEKGRARVLEKLNWDDVSQQMLGLFQEIQK